MYKFSLMAATAFVLASPVTLASGSSTAETHSPEVRTEQRLGDPAFDAATLTGTTIWTEVIQPGLIPPSLASVLDFDAGGTGTSYEKILPYLPIEDPADIPETFSWSIDAGALTIVFDDFTESSFPSLTFPYDSLRDIYGFDQDVVDFMIAAFQSGDFLDGTQVEMVLTQIQRVVTIDSVGARRIGVSSSNTSEYNIDALLTSLNWPGPLPRGDASFVSNKEIYLNSEITSVLVNPPAAGDTWAVPFLFRPLDPAVVEETDEGFFVDSLTLDALGATSTGQLSNKNFAWSTTADGLTLDSGTDQYTYVPIESDGSVLFALTTYLSEGDVQLRTAGWIARSDGTGSTLAADLVQPIPFYWQAGVNTSLAARYRDSGQLAPNWVFGYSFNNDNTSFRVFGPFEDNCVLGDLEPCFVPEGDPLWTWTASGDTIVRDRNSPSFDRSRTWKVLSYQPGGKATVLEWSTIEFTAVPADFLINPRVNTLEVFNLSSWPEEWADSEGFYPATDDDGDGIANAADNCLQVASTDLRDGDGDGIGTVCDTDHNQDCVVNFLDLSLFAENFLGSDDNYDYTGDGLVNFVDLAVLGDSIFSNFSSGPDVSGVPNLCN